MSIAVKTDTGWQVLGVGGDGDCDLVGGVAGWAAIESVSGTASLDDLKAAGIAPATATVDDKCPGTYNIVGDDGVVYRVAVWTDTNGTNSLTASGGLLDTMVVSGGGVNSNTSAYAGQVHNGLRVATGATYSIEVGHGGNPAHGSSIWDPNDSGPRWIIASTMSGYGSGNYGTGNNGPNARAGKFSDITGVNIEYAGGAGRLLGTPGSAAQSPPEPLSSFSGIVVVRAPKDAANNPKPDAPVAWGEFTTNGDEQDSGTWGPDAQGRMWKWAEWNVGDDYSVNLTGGQYWVLTVGAGAAEYQNTTPLWSGSAGLVNEGYWEFGSGDTPIKVAAQQQNAAGTAAIGAPSSIGGYGPQGGVWWGNSANGWGSTTYGDDTGYKSFITGDEREYAPGHTGPERPGRASQRGHGHRDGCVIIATVTNDESDWNPPGALPGIGGWATITSVTGMPNRYTYNDGIDWVAFEWTDTSTTQTLTTQAGGLVDVLIVGGGGLGQSGGARAGNGGGVIDGVRLLGISSEVLVGAGSSNETYIKGTASALGSTQIDGGTRGNFGPNGYGYADGVGYAGGIGATGLNTGNTGGPGVVSSIRDGNPREYGRGGDVGNGPPPSNTGQGGHTQGAGGHLGSNGVVICRVPADLAAGVDPATYNDVTVRSVAKEKAKEAVKSEIKSRRKKK